MTKEYFDRKVEKDTCRAPSIRIFNTLLNGWSRSRKLKHAERLWLEMKKKNVKTSTVTYDTLVGGYCWTRRVERAFELVDEMKREGIKSNATVCNPIIDALAEAGRFKEVLGIMENFFLSETVPNISTCNSYVKGCCKLSKKRRDVICTAGLEFNLERVSLVKAYNNQGFTRSLRPKKYIF